MAMGSSNVGVGVSYILLVLIMVGFVRSDMAKDRGECAEQLIGLATCLPYVGGDAKAPTLDCCTGLKQVLNKSRKCLCILIKDRNDPALGIKINATLALGLPTSCHAPSNVSECPTLLHLDPNSPDAQVFLQYANSTKGSTPVATGNPTSTASSTTHENSDGGREKRWVGVKMVVRRLELRSSTDEEIDQLNAQLEDNWKELLIEMDESSFCRCHSSPWLPCGGVCTNMES
ncbi:hypothetical protein HHK36_012055 [Tetracentron sinense]|uniref:Bifunctional inhibitor/plant lipid transfer protein/seed storage helical domain-containing protein n=1 Tax=Tetracentron sinense TaxID=13715 RepID=A0A835DHT1_TETSI|nr:hypothetical protein HHK36_012055 [Tetracentron sinense]